MDTPRSSQPQLVNPTTQVEGSEAKSPSIETENVPKVPPVVLKNASEWTMVCGKLRERRINYTTYTNHRPRLQDSLQATERGKRGIPHIFPS